MQVQTIITAYNFTRLIPQCFSALVVLHLASLSVLAYSVCDLGMRGAGHSPQSGVSTVPPLQTPVRRGFEVNSTWRKQEKGSRARLPFRQHLLQTKGEFTLPFHPGLSVDSPGCSPKTKSLSSSPFWYAHDRPDWHAPNSGTRSASGTWCNSGLARTSTGRQAYCWSARCAMTAASAALCCGRTGAAPGRHGTRTAAQRCCASAGRRLRDQGGKSTTPATLQRVQDVWVGGETGANVEYYVNSDQLSLHNIAISRRSRSP